MNKFMAVVKSPKVLITGAVLLAFAVGAIFEGYTKFGTTSASSQPTEAIAAAANPGASAATNEAASANGAGNTTADNSAETVPATEAAAEPAAPASSAPQPVHRKRSFEKEALIVGGSAAGGAAIGGIAGGGKGAGIGALSGGAAGLIYDLATRNK